MADVLAWIVFLAIRKVVQALGLYDIDDLDDEEINTLAALATDLEDEVMASLPEASSQALAHEDVPGGDDE